MANPFSEIFVNSLTKSFLILFIFCYVAAAPAKEQRLLVLNYHDIIGIEEAKFSANAMDVSIDHFKGHLGWLKKNSYKIISIQQVFDAAAGKTALPDKAVLLTFDDGYLSFYQRVFPLLKKYRYPALIAPVGEWMDGQVSAYDPGKPLLNWAQIGELVRSGLVELASHSYDLHKGLSANPQESSQAAAVTHWYDEQMLVYETDQQYSERIRAAMLKSAEFIFQHAGIRPRVMIWPYGEFNQITVQAAREAGMPVTMGLQDGNNTLADIGAMRRLIIVDNPDVEQFAEIVSGMRQGRALRVAHLDLDYLYDKDPDQTKHNLDAAVQRIKDMHINTVFLQAYADPDGDGNADALYFPNRHLPVTADLFSHAAWQLKTAAGVKVYAWMPILAYVGKIPEEWYVQEWRDGKAERSSHIYRRLSPFNPNARRFISEIYEDLAKYCNFDGILFHDDGILSDYEDVSPLALNFTKEVWGLPEQFDRLHDTNEMRMAWAQHKTELINRFTDELADRVRIYRPGIKTARNFYAVPLLKPYAEEWFAQSFNSFLAYYDYVAIEAMPFMEEADNPNQWLKQLVDAASKVPGGLKQTIFELQAVDWKKQQKIPMPVFIEQFELLKKSGGVHFAYYPDNVFEDQPRLTDLQKYYSLPDLP